MIFFRFERDYVGQMVKEEQQQRLQVDSELGHFFKFVLDPFQFDIELLP